MSATAPVIFGDARNASALSRAVKSGRARRLAHGLYTLDLESPPEVVVRRAWLEVTAHFCPGAVITDRSAPAAQPDANGLLFVVHPRARPAQVPGLTIVPRPGPGPEEDDLPLPNGLFLASRPRALLENARESRAVKGRPPRTLNRRELHDWIVRLLKTEGPGTLGVLRDRARILAAKWEMDREQAIVDEAIGAALGTREVETESPGLEAAIRGRPFDEDRARLFEILANHLSVRAPSPRPVVLRGDSLRNLAFFEAYFSNFIEGTEFTVEEAASIVFGGAIPAGRPADAHDVLGTFRVVADPEEMSLVPTSPEDLMGSLRRRHARIMEGRPEKRPGEWKEKPNRAGSTFFVSPHLVEGTLAKGFRFLETLADPFARAVFTLFLVSEVHPFDDGNGRVARVMMNAELHVAREARILIPTVFRNEYLSSLRALTHNGQPGALTRVLDFAQRYTAQVAFSDFDRARATLEATQAFVDPAEALDRGIRLLLPTAIPR